MNGNTRRRRELGDFLRARRQHVARDELGLPPIARRSTGLRREEVSYLSGVSVTWYTWLEQGRDITPSRQVLDAVARTLCLSGPEHAYLLSLAGYSAPWTEPAPQLPPHVQRLLDALDGLPAYVLAPDWTILGWTPPFAALYPGVATTDEAERNLLWLVFTDPYLRDLQADWEFHSAQHLAEFRAEAGPRLAEARFARLVARLLEVSEHFRVNWANHDIQGFTSRERVYHHPTGGDFRLELHRMALSDQPDLRLMIYTPVPGTDAPELLRRLLSSR
jgi:hypothetical protein